MPIAILEIIAGATVTLPFSVNICSPFSCLVAMVFCGVASPWVCLVTVLHRIHLPRLWKSRHDLLRNARVLALKR
jgi:zinc transporter ZupT